MTGLQHNQNLAISIILLLAGSLSAADAVADNMLDGHPSPYLALHAGDPVDWQSWQADVFKQARTDNKLVFVSVGYFSCHWCHVMQQESYQHGATAEYLNQNYISVKIDRELDPDLDRRLIEFVKQIRGAAGWPLNVFLTPQGYPLTGFTYLPRDDFLRVIQQLNKEWQRNHAALSASARDFFESTQQQGSRGQDVSKIPANKLQDAFINQAMQAADILQGGFGNTSKFPNVPRFDSLLDSVAGNRNPDAEVVDFINLSLHVMATQNLLDHVNGGFFRYTTDPDWQTPHFEKMLYDNALLAELYLKAHRIWPQRGYADLALLTLDFVETSLKHEGGGYMSSLSAVDREGREGGAYLWTREQLQALLEPDEFDFFSRNWPSLRGEFLIPAISDQGPAAVSGIRKNILLKLQSRGSDSMPVDDKRLASWNAMLLSALTAATDIEPALAARAEQLFRHMREIFFEEGRLIRFAGNAAIADAVFEDYAYTALAFQRYGERFADEDALELARLLCERAYELFLVDDLWQEKAKTLIPIARGKWIIEDLVFNSPMTLWLQVALTLPQLDAELRAQARAMLQRDSRDLQANPYHYGSFISLRARSSD